MFKIKIIYFLLAYTLRGTFRQRAALERFQQRKWRRFRKIVLTHSPFYQELAQREADLSDFPLMNKAAFMANFDQINTLGIQREEAMQLALQAEMERDFSPELKGATVGLSTGTSGTRGLFLVSNTERAKWTAMVLRRVVPLKLFKKQRVAFFLRANSNLYSSVQSASLEFRFFDIFQPIGQLVQALAEFQPHILAAQPSVLSAIAEYQLAGEIQIHPSLIISFAEVLTTEDKTFIQNTWSAPLREVYQCTEGFLGVTCAQGTLHLNEDIAIFEKKYLDETRFIPIITDFTRSSQPIVRYELNDILVEKTEPCTCGSCFTALERIEGREDDILLFPGANGEMIKVFPDLICRVIARSAEGFRAYRLRQIEPLVLQLELESANFEGVAEKITNGIQSFLQERGVLGVTLRCVEGIQKKAGEKLRRVERKIVPN
ncbi:F390 synthetase-related protein [Haliscomenobacter hydrossis]|uniref:Adenylate-forming enzyme n=1 Tax=Haliscomenobacter hydrossis (strain ATCC 27775 / DSM 1100 / LMG 10767 / O) TaxID=760192 RepID=F4KZW9_HALH1|nr:F390 synthetase-related protein [Haliscomenobacter hydrossis]AEE51539.1 adenylate-forming enzyme [Haliscomenobacter hydrossis DSM 1100]